MDRCRSFCVLQETPSSTGLSPSGRQEPPASPEPPPSDSLSTRAAQLAAEVFASPLFYLVAGLGAIKLVREQPLPAPSL